MREVLHTHELKYEPNAEYNVHTTCVTEVIFNAHLLIFFQVAALNSHPLFTAPGCKYVNNGLLVNAYKKQGGGADEYNLVIVIIFITIIHVSAYLLSVPLPIHPLFYHLPFPGSNMDF